MPNGPLVIPSDMKSILRILTLLLLFSSCSDIGDCFHGTGEQAQEERTLDTIRGIYLTSNINLKVHPNATYYRMRVTAGENLIEGVETKAENGTLSIRNNNHCNWVRSFKSKITVDVWVPSLNSIYIENSTGDITIDDSLRAENFRVDCFGSMGSVQMQLKCQIATIALHNGPADITASGSADVQYNYNAGFGKIDCRSLISRDIYIKNKGTNNTWVNSNNILDAIIEHDGNIYYTGQPSQVIADIKGKGQLIKF